MNVNEVITSDWQISMQGMGGIAQGADDINQCIAIILNTQKGSDPVRPDFGVDLLSWIDQPQNAMAPGLVKEMIDQIGLYEPRIELSTVNYSFDTGQVIFALTWAYQGAIIPGGIVGGEVDGSSSAITYFLLSDENGFVLLTDFEVSIILN